jgi:hypothetical protein
LREFVHVLDLIDQRSDYDAAADWDFSVNPSDVRPEEEEALHDARREVSF